MNSVVVTIPHFWKAIGRERTPPPTIVAIRLNVPTISVDGRLLLLELELLSSLKGGAR